MISFVRYRIPAALFSLSIIAVFAGLAVYRMQTRGYVFTYSVDFTGGTQVLLKFDKEIQSLTLSGILGKAGFEGVTTREFGKQEILVRVKDFSNDAKGLAERMRQAIIQALPDYQVSILQSEGVGPGIGANLRWKSVRAVLISLIAILAYISFRFWSVGFALGAVVALFHDALITLACFLFLEREISVYVIGAILTVLGYSVNDTIVIFSQIRKNLKEMHHVPLSELVDISLNQTLRRTILTSFSTALVVISMLLLGGEVLRDFSIALLVGIVFGTYSSIYIASPIMMLLAKRK